MNLYMNNLSQNLYFYEGHFDPFQGQKTCFLKFLKIILELLKSRLGIFLPEKANFLFLFLYSGFTFNVTPTQFPLLWGPVKP